MKTVIAYTDGGCRGNGKIRSIGGYGVVIRNEEYARELSQGYTGTTNNEMEIMACVAALEEIKKSYDRHTRVNIYSDSAYVVNCFKQTWWVKWKYNGWKNAKGEAVKNKELWEHLIRLTEDFEDVNFNKVKGHSTDELNNRADQLANDAMDKVQKKVGRTE